MSPLSTQKIFNDPVYGFITIPNGILLDLIAHPYFQRLNRIKQVGMGSYVYPGANHTRFHHALGALHLMTEAIEVLRGKGADIRDEEATAVCIAILLHDIGHGPFSHALEHTLVHAHHEDLSLLFMERLNEAFDGQLDLAIRIFRDDYPKKFLHRLVSGQLDMDRLDYLNRDSFFTGVSEGVIGYDRIIKMLAVAEGELVVEEKGIYSIEKFLISRRLMYWQVYLHKTVVAAEQMLIRAVRRARHLASTGQLRVDGPLDAFLRHDYTIADFSTEPDLLEQYALLDDCDIVYLLKSCLHHADPLMAYLSRSLIHRRLFKLEFSYQAFDRGHVESLRRKAAALEPGIDPGDIAGYLVFEGQESNSAYSTQKDEIMILYKNGKILPMSAFEEEGIAPRIITKHYVCYPKVLAGS